MPTLKKIIFTAFFSLIIVSLGYFVVFAWTPPTGAPPAGNIAAPLNTGSVTQSKTGGVNVGGNVGIGTTSPGARLEISSGQIFVPNGAVGAPSYSFSGAANSGIYYTALTNSLSVARLGGEYIRVNGNGVTITNGKLMISSQGSPSSPAIVLESDGNTGISWGGGGAGLLIFSTLGTEHLRIDASGNVGIGTTNPGAKLEVAGNVKIQGSINRGPTNLPLFRWLPIGIMATYTGTGSSPEGIAFDGANMWTANSGNNSVTKITPTGAMTTYTGTGSWLQGIAFDGTNMWTANASGNSVTKITPTGAMTTYAGTGNNPAAIAFDGANMWTANSGNNSVTKITLSGAMTTYAGTGASPAAIAFDGANMWTANYDGNSVTKITPTGAMTTYTGTGALPRGIAFDGANMWTANVNGNSVTKITPTGAMTTYAGINSPIAIAFDGTNMWTANNYGSVTKITPTGAMTTYAGTGSNSTAIAFDGTNMWTANSGNNSVTKILVITQ